MRYGRFIQRRGGRKGGKERACTVRTSLGPTEAQIGKPFLVYLLLNFRQNFTINIQADPEALKIPFTDIINQFKSA